MSNDQLLTARRLVEAGARCVTVAYGFWDTHGQNFSWLRQRLPLFDQGISALVEDIYARGWIAMLRSSSGASLAAARRSTKTPAATTGHASTQH